jgi:hypothetical protein
MFEVSFDDPPRVLAEGSESLQEWRIRARKSANGGPDPVVRLELVDGASGDVLETVIEDEVVSVTDSIVLEGTWDAAILPAQSGLSVEARLTSINTKGHTRVDIAALQWAPVMSDSIAAFVGVRWNVRSNVASAPLNLRWNVSVPGLYPEENLYPANNLYPQEG